MVFYLECVMVPFRFCVNPRVPLRERDVNVKCAKSKTRRSFNTLYLDFDPLNFRCMRYPVTKMLVLSNILNQQ